MAQKIYIGNTEVANLDKVYTKSEVNTQLSTKASTQQLTAALAAIEHEIGDVSSDKQDKLTAGSNITISNDVISSTDTTYSAGNGLSIDANNEFSVDTTTIATKEDLGTKQDTLTAGEGITIEDNVISSEGTTYTAGTNISIDNDVISATDTTYAAGTGLSLENGEFSVDETVIATKSELNDKQNIATLDTDVATLGFTKTHGTLTGITMNSSSVSVENGVADLGTVITDISGKQDILTAGSNIDITNNVISATDTTYSAGNGLNLSGTEFSIDTATVATQSDLLGKQDILTAGSNIDITSDVISVDSTGASDGQVLTADGSGGTTWEDISSGTTDYDDLNNIPIINQAVTTQMEAFVANETVLTSSSIIHFDTSAEGTTALETMMADATTSSSISSILSTNNGTSIAMYILKSSSKYGLVIVNNSTGQFVPIYATEAFSYQSMITFTGGWEAVVDQSTGNYVIDTITSSTTVSSINDIDSWNGNIFGLGIETATPAGIQGNYYRKNGGDIYYFDGANYKKLAIGDFLAVQDPVAFGSFSINRNTLYGIGTNSISVGDGCIAIGSNSAAFGDQTKALGENSHAEGSGNYASTITASGEARGYTITTSNSVSSIKPGYKLYYSGTNKLVRVDSVDDTSTPYVIHISNWLFDENKTNAAVTVFRDGALGRYSHSEGSRTVASGDSSHAEGYDTIAYDDYSHAEGGNTTASNRHSHAEGYYTTASGQHSHAEGNNTTASGDDSHAEGFGTIALRRAQHVFGRNNIEDPGSEGTDYYNHGKYVEIVGNGDELNAGASRSNARTLDWDGNEWLAGAVTAAGFKVDGRSATDVLKADGSVSPVSYLTLTDIPIIDESSASSLSSYSIGDIIKNGDKLHLDNTANFYDTIRSLPYDSSTNIATLIDAGQASVDVLRIDGSVYIMYVGSDVLFVLLPSWYTYIEYNNIKYTFGFYSVDENNDYTFELSAPETIVNFYTPASEEDAWNGVSICKVQNNLENGKYYCKNSIGGKLKVQALNDTIIETIISEKQDLNSIDFSSISHPGPIANSVSLLETKETPTSQAISKLYAIDEQSEVPSMLDRLCQRVEFNSNVSISASDFTAFTYTQKYINHIYYDYLQLAKYIPIDSTRTAYELCIIHNSGNYYNIVMKPLDDDSTTGTWIYGAVQGWQNTDFTLDNTYGNYYELNNLYQEILVSTEFFETYDIRYQYNYGKTLYTDIGAVYSEAHQAQALQLTSGIISFVGSDGTFIPDVGTTLNGPFVYATVKIDNSTHEIDWSTYKVIPYDKIFINNFSKSPSVISYIDSNYYCYKVRLVYNEVEIYKYSNDINEQVLVESDIKYRHDVFISATVQSTDIAIGFSVYTATKDYNNDFDTLITDLVDTYDNISTNTTDDILANGLYDTSNTPKQVKCVFASTNTPDPSLQVKTWDGSQAGIIVSNITDCYITAVKII